MPQKNEDLSDRTFNSFYMLLQTRVNKKLSQGADIDGLNKRDLFLALNSLLLSVLTKYYCNKDWLGFIPSLFRGSFQGLA